MAWIVIGEEKGKIKLISRRPLEGENPGLLPKGSYLTVEPENTNSKFILRVDNSSQYEPYQPSPMIVDMQLDSLYEDRKCQNIILAYRVKDMSDRKDGKIDFIPPQSIARRSTQDEIDIALGSIGKGPKVFLATIQAGQNQLLVDDNLNFITARLPIDMFYHQSVICGSTGSGKTVAMKYLAQYFVEKLEGAVLAVNVKESDFLMMNRPSKVFDTRIQDEWAVLNEDSHGIENTINYYPANTDISEHKGINLDICRKITLNVEEIDPDSLTGLLENISEVGAQSLPDIFRYWFARERTNEDNFNEFVNYFIRAERDQRRFNTLNIRGDESNIQLHSGTYHNILRNLNSAVEFFDNPDAESLAEDDVLQQGKLSVINVVGFKGTQFGSVLLRHLLKKIVEAKRRKEFSVPILIIIDEVHQFYHTEASREALGYLDIICRTGRSNEIGIIFSSQNLSDIPKGLLSVVNTKIYFKSSGIPSSTYFGISNEEMESLQKGFAVANIHELSQLRILKFPLSFAGVFEKEKENGT